MFPEITRDDIFRLETERLWLRWPRALDAPVYARLAGDPEIALKTARIPQPYEPRTAEDFIMLSRAENDRGDGLSLALTLKRQPEDPIGVIGAHGGAHRGVATFGFWLGKDYWNQGLMTEAAMAFLDAIFGVTSLERVDSHVMFSNPASKRVHEKLGFVSQGRCSYPAPARGGDVPAERFTLTRGAGHTAFAARRPKYSAP